MTLKTRAAIKAVFGEPLLVDEIELEDPGDEEVLVKLFATGICHSQLHQIHNPDGPVPTLLGHEGTGIVLKAGSKVSHVKEGERVMIQFVPRDLPDGMTTAKIQNGCARAIILIFPRAGTFQISRFRWRQPRQGSALPICPASSPTPTLNLRACRRGGAMPGGPVGS